MCLDTSAPVPMSYGQFGTGAEVSPVQTVSGPSLVAPGLPKIRPHDCTTTYRPHSILVHGMETPWTDRTQWNVVDDKLTGID